MREEETIIWRLATRIFGRTADAARREFRKGARSEWLPLKHYISCCTSNLQLKRLSCTRHLPGKLQQLNVLFALAASGLFRHLRSLPHFSNAPAITEARHLHPKLV